MADAVSDDSALLDVLTVAIPEDVVSGNRWMIARFTFP